MLIRIIFSTLILISISLYTTYFPISNVIADTLLINNSDDGKELIKYVGTCTTQSNNSPIVESLCAIEIEFYFNYESESFELLTFVSPYSPNMGGSYLIEWYSKSSSLVSISDTTQLVPRFIIFKSHKPSMTCHSLYIDGLTTFCFTGGKSK